MFGGLLIGQALRAAQLTVPADRPAHSLHLSFAVAGTGGEPIRYEVERTRDGGSFATRRVVARQERGVVARAHRRLPPTTSPASSTRPRRPRASPAPTGCPSVATTTRTSSRATCRSATTGRTACRTPGGSWFRPTAPVPDDPLLHIQTLAYLSDHGPTRAAREPHAGLADDARRMSVSLDHSVWFHRPVDVNQWLLSELVPVATGRGRGLSLGTIRTADGTLLATVAQEVLLRTR